MNDGEYNGRLHQGIACCDRVEGDGEVKADGRDRQRIGTCFQKSGRLRIP